MDLMNQKERKESYKLPVILVTLFLVLGVAFIVYSLSIENEPNIIGEHIDVNIYDNNYLKDVEQDTSNDNIIGEYVIGLESEYINDSNGHLKSKMTLPIISVNYEKMEELNSEIKENFITSFNEFKETMQNVENNFTYKVTYKYYENSFDNMDILSVTMYERIIDDSNGGDVIEKIHAYNIDLSTLEVLTQKDVVMEILGKDYKSIIKNCINDYVKNNNMANDDYHYSCTNLEKFYIKENTFRLLFDPGELVDERFSIINIKIEEEK